MGRDRKRSKSAATAGAKAAADGQVSPATGSGPKAGERRLERAPRAASRPPAAPAESSKPARRRAVPPSLTHGTRVHFEIVCARCGRQATLPFVPKTTGEVLCQTCAADVFGPDWAHGRKVAHTQEWPFTCAKCGRQETVPFEPKADRELLCRACLRGEEQPDKERLRRMKRVD